MAPRRRMVTGSPGDYTSAMSENEEAILAVAAMILESAAMNDAALAKDFDEARFRAQLIMVNASTAGHVDLAVAAAHVIVVMGSPGSLPSPGYGEAMFRVAEALGAIDFKPR
jgi:hypothetical protein